MLTSFARRDGMLRQASAGIGFPRAVRGSAVAPWATTLRGRLASVRLGPSGRVSPPSSPSVPSREVPGFGAPALPSALDLESLALAMPVAEVAVAILPAPPRHPAGEPSAEPWSSLPVQRHLRGSNPVGEEGRVNEELSESPGQGALCAFG